MDSDAGRWDCLETGKWRSPWRIPSVCSGRHGMRLSVEMKGQGLRDMGGESMSGKRCRDWGELIWTQDYEETRLTGLHTYFFLCREYGVDSVERQEGKLQVTKGPPNAGRGWPIWKKEGITIGLRLKMVWYGWADILRCQGAGASPQE